MTNQSNYEKSVEKKETSSLVDDNIDHSISEKEFDWDFILDKEWSRTKK